MNVVESVERIVLALSEILQAVGVIIWGDATAPMIEQLWLEICFVLSSQNPVRLFLLSRVNRVNRLLDILIIRIVEKLLPPFVSF